MSTYVLPQVQVFQDLQRQPAVEANPLSAHISGGHAHLVRWTDANERETGYLGLYDRVTNNDYAWPTRPAGSIVDQSYTRVFVKDALLRYFTDAVSAGGTIYRTAGSFNRIRANSINFVTANGTSRSAGLADRDVRIGDVIKVTGTPTGGGGLRTLWTHVVGFVPEVVASVVGSAAPIAGNRNTGTLSTAISQTAGPENCVTATSSAASYNGLPAGRTTETYTIQVLQSSINGNHTTAVLRAISASGTDNVMSFSPAAAASPTAIGTRGLTVTFGIGSGPDCSDSAVNDGVSEDDLIAGQIFTVTVSQAFTATTVTSGGTYSGDTNTTYIVEVTKGGTFAQSPEISVTTTNGYDQSGPTVVSGLSVAVPIGSRGVTMTFAGSTQGLAKGDRFSVTATAATAGAIKTLVLADNLDSGFATNDDLAIELFIREQELELTANRTGFAPLKNWTQDANDLTVNSGVTVFHPTWTSAGVPQPLPLYSSAALDYGKVYVHYRAWLSTLSGQMTSVSDVSELDEISGALTPDNPLKWGVFTALSNNNGTPVLFTSVADPGSLDSWQALFDVLLSSDEAYGLVPLTRDPAVLQLFRAHVDSTSSPLVGLWRTAWFNLSGVPEKPLVSAGSSVPGYTAATTSNGTDALAVFEEFGSTGAFTVLRVPANNSRFTTNGVRPGDIVRALYVGDGFGEFTYSTFEVESVTSESQLKLVSGPSVAQPVPAKIEVWRTLSLTEEAEEVGKAAAAYGNRRIRATWPDVIESAGTVQPGYFLNCALAALASAVLPQQGLTNVEVAGFSAVSRTTQFSRAQLDVMAGSGVWIVTRDNTGKIFNRHAVTTGAYDDINQREESITRNIDSISYRFKDYLKPFIGVTNVTPTMQETIQGGIIKLIRTLQSERVTNQLGGQLIDATIDRFFVSSIFKDRYVVYLSLQVPYALNTIELHLVA